MFTFRPRALRGKSRIPRFLACAGLFLLAGFLDRLGLTMPGVFAGAVAFMALAAD